MTHVSFEVEEHLWPASNQFERENTAPGIQFAFSLTDANRKAARRPPRKLVRA